VAGSRPACGLFDVEIDSALADLIGNRRQRQTRCVDDGGSRARTHYTPPW
jgi:hypothetical protein